MFEISYPATITQDREGKDWVAKFPDLQGTNTGADTREGAFDEAADCLGSYLALLIAKRQPIPEPSARKGKQVLISVPLWIAPKVALYRAMMDQGISKSDLARRLGVTETVVRRMLDPDHASKAARLDSALRAVGKRLLVAVADAA